MRTMTRDFTKTKAALAVYDKADEKFRASSERLSNKKVMQALEELDTLSLAVGRAFCEETSDVNSMSCATVAKPGEWLRRTIGVV